LLKRPWYDIDKMKGHRPKKTRLKDTGLRYNQQSSISATFAAAETVTVVPSDKWLLLLWRGAEEEMKPAPNSTETSTPYPFLTATATGQRLHLLPPPPPPQQQQQRFRIANPTAPTRFLVLTTRCRTGRQCKACTTAFALFSTLRRCPVLAYRLTVRTCHSLRQLRRHYYAVLVSINIIKFRPENCFPNAIVILVDLAADFARERASACGRAPARTHGAMTHFQKPEVVERCSSFARRVFRAAV
jgi:hypothetical protein